MDPSDLLSPSFLEPILAAMTNYLFCQPIGSCSIGDIMNRNVHLLSHPLPPAF